MEPKGSLPLSKKARYLSRSQSIQSTPPSHFLNIYFNFISPLRLGLPVGSIRSPTKPLDSSVLSPTPATWPAHLIPLDLVTPIIFGKEHRSWRQEHAFEKRKEPQHFSKAYRPVFRPIHRPMKWLLGTLYCEIQQHWGKAGHSRPSNTQVENEWSYTFITLQVLMVFV